MGFPGAVTVFTPNTKFRERRIHHPRTLARCNPGTSAVTHDAAGENRSIETIVSKFIPGRKTPFARLGVVGKRSLKEVPPALHNPADAIGTGADQQIQFACIAEDLLAGGVHCILALVQVAITAENFEMAVETWRGYLSLGRNLFQNCGRDCRHGSAHVRLRE